MKCIEFFTNIYICYIYTTTDVWIPYIRYIVYCITTENYLCLFTGIQAKKNTIGRHNHNFLHEESCTGRKLVGIYIDPTDTTTEYSRVQSMIHHHPPWCLCWEMSGGDWYRYLYPFHFTILIGSSRHQLEFRSTLVQVPPNFHNQSSLGAAHIKPRTYPTGTGLCA